MGNDEDDEEVIDEKTKMSILDRWAKMLNTKLEKLDVKTTLLPVPACYGHMYRNVRFIPQEKRILFNDKVLNVKLDENTSKVAKCYVCHHENKCFHLSSVSYLYQVRKLLEESQ